MDTVADARAVSGESGKENLFRKQCLMTIILDGWFLNTVKHHNSDFLPCWLVYCATWNTLSCWHVRKIRKGLFQRTLQIQTKVEEPDKHRTPHQAWIGPPRKGPRSGGETTGSSVVVGVYPCFHWLKGRTHPGQDTSPSQITHTVNWCSWDICPYISWDVLYLKR